MDKSLHPYSLDRQDAAVWTKRSRVRLWFANESFVYSEASLRAIVRDNLGYGQLNNPEDSTIPYTSPTASSQRQRPQLSCNQPVESGWISAKAAARCGNRRSVPCLNFAIHHYYRSASYQSVSFDCTQSRSKVTIESTNHDENECRKLIGTQQEPP